jgi:hypothetical protein
LTPLHNRVLPPHVGESGLDVVREVHIHSAARQEEKQGAELENDEQDAEEKLENQR